MALASINTPRFLRLLRFIHVVAVAIMIAQATPNVTQNHVLFTSSVVDNSVPLVANAKSSSSASSASSVLLGISFAGSVEGIPEV